MTYIRKLQFVKPHINVEYVTNSNYKEMQLHSVKKNKKKR